MNGCAIAEKFVAVEVCDATTFDSSMKLATKILFDEKVKNA